MVFSLPPYDKALDGFLRSTDPKVIDFISAAQASVRAPDPIQPEVDLAIDSLENIRVLLTELDQSRALLGLDADFLKSELVSAPDLGSRMEIFFQGQLEAAVAAVVSIESAKAANCLIELTVASKIEKAPTVIKDDERLILKEGDRGQFPEDVEWDSVALLPRLQREEGLPLAFEERASFVDQYEEIRVAIEGNEDLPGLQKDSIVLRKKKNSLEIAKETYLSKLTKTLGFQKDLPYSSKFKYFEFPVADFLAAELASPISEAAFPKLKALGVGAISGVNGHFKLEVVEAYLRMKIFKEYCQYVDLRYGTEDDFFDPSFEKRKKLIKVEIANALGLTSYFWKTDPPISLSFLPQLMKNLKLLNDMLPQSIRAPLNNLHMEKLVEVLHQEGLIFESLEKTTSKSTGKKANDTALFTNCEEPLPHGYRSSFRIGKVKDIRSSINDVVTQFVRSIKGELDLKEVLPVVGGGGVTENSFLMGSFPTHFYQKQHSLFWGDPKTKSEANSVYKRLQAIAQTEPVVLQTNLLIDTSLAGFAVNSKFYLEGLVSAQGITAFIAKRSVIEQQINALLSLLPIGTQANSTLIQKLHTIAEFLLEPCRDIQQLLQNRADSLMREAKFYEAGSLDGMDRSRDFFKEYVRELLSDQYQEAKARIHALEAQRALDANDILKCIGYSEEIEQELLTIQNLNEKTALFASAIFNLYRHIYDPKQEGSVMRAYLEVAKADSSRFEFEGLEKLSVDFKGVAPGIFTDITQILKALKTDLAIRTQMAWTISNSEEIKCSESLLEKKVAYQEIQEQVSKVVQDVIQTQDSAAESFKAPAQKIMQESLSLDTEKKYYGRQVTHLGLRLQKFVEFDPTEVSSFRQVDFYSLDQSSNPHMQLWLDAKKFEGPILEKVFEAFKGFSAGTPLSLQVPLSKEEERAAISIDHALSFLDQESNFFDIDVESPEVSSKALVPIQYGVDRGADFFKVFSPQEIADLVVRTFRKAEEMALLKYKEELGELSFSSLRAEQKKNKEQIEVISEEMNSAESELEAAKQNVQSAAFKLQNASPQRTKELQKLQADVEEMGRLKSQMQDSAAMLKHLKSALGSSEIETPAAAKLVIEQAMEKQKENGDLSHCKWTTLYVEAKGASEKLGFADIKGPLSNLLEKIQEELSSIQPRVEVEGSIKKYTQAIPALEKNIALLEERLDTLLASSQRVSAMLENHSSQRECQKMHEELLFTIRRRALESACKIFILPYSEGTLAALDYFREKKA